MDGFSRSDVPGGAPSAEHPRRRRAYRDDRRGSGLEQALQAGEDCRPAEAATGQDVVAKRPVVRLDQRQLHHITHRLDLVGDERGPKLFHQRRPVDVERERELPRRLAFDHFARDVRRPIRRVHDVRAADPQIDLDRIAEEIFPAELRRRQRLPHLLGRGGDVDGVDDGGFE